MCHPCLSKMVVLHFKKKGGDIYVDDAVCLLINHEGKYIILKLNECSYSQSLSPPRRNLNLSSRPRLLQPPSPQPPLPQPPNPLLSLIHISEPTRRTPTSYAVFCLK